MRLILMEDLHIQPSEIDKLDEETRWQYYYFCIAKRKIENEEARKPMKDRNEKATKNIHFPEYFVSQIENKITIMKLNEVD